MGKPAWHLKSNANPNQVHASDLSPAAWPHEPSLEWAAAGDGALYAALHDVTVTASATGEALYERRTAGEEKSHEEGKDEDKKTSTSKSGRLVEGRIRSHFRLRLRLLPPFF